MTQIDNVVPLNCGQINANNYQIHVGNKKSSDGIPGDGVYYTPDTASNYFTSITGKSGAGKTYLIRKLVSQFNSSGRVTTIIIDTQGDFSPNHFEEYLPGMGGCVKHNSFDYIDSPVTINPFKITITGSNSDYIFAFKNVIESIKCFNPSLGVQQESLLNQIITQAYSDKGINGQHPETWTATPPVIDNVLEIAECILAETESGLSSSVMSKVYKAVKKSSLLKRKIDAGGSSEKLNKLYADQEDAKESLKSDIANLIDSDDISAFSNTSTSVERITSICNTLRDMKACGIFGTDTISISEGKINVIDISELHPSTYPTLIHLLLYRTFQSSVLLKKKSGLVTNRLATLLVFDEGKIFASSSQNEMSPLKRIIEEGRKFGLGGIFGLQNARQIPPAFLSNIATSFILPVSANDVKQTATTYDVDKDKLRYLIPKKQALFASDSPDYVTLET